MGGPLFTALMKISISATNPCHLFALACELARVKDRVTFRPSEEVPVSRTMLQTVMRERVALVTFDAQADQRLSGGESIRLHQIRSAMCAPLWSGERIMGVIQVDSRTGVSAEDLAGIDFSDDLRVLIKTHNSRLWGDPEFHTDYVGVTESGAKHLVAHGIKVVGVDYLSVESFRQPGAPAHHILLGAGTIVIEGLDLRAVEPGIYEMFCLPLRIAGSDGVTHSADMVRATAYSGGRVFAMGTMELAWALDGPDGRSPNPELVAFVEAGLRDLTRPAPPATGKNSL